MSSAASMNPAARGLHIVISRGQSKNPQKRALEDEVARGIAGSLGLRVTLTPNLYDLTPDGKVFSWLRQCAGDLVVLSWLYPRAAHWLLDRQGVQGQMGHSQLSSEAAEDDDQEEESASEPAGDDKVRVLDERRLPDRQIYCVDLRAAHQAQAFTEEAQRLALQIALRQRPDLAQWLQGQGAAQQLARYLQTADDAPAPGNGEPSPSGNGNHSDPSHGVEQLQEQSGRRWYPVIDYARCTNCMECIDFCLFGVYGVDLAETILVEQPDNCRKGCPACSRVCPENAIIFPQHKTPAIAGSNESAASLKIDLSQLFGAPDAMDVAARERDEQLLLAGRQAVGLSAGVPKRQEGQPSAPRDALDSLIDELDDLDL